MKRNLFVVVCFLFSCASLLAQELKVKSFERLERDLLALTQKRLDLNDNPCAVLRISVPNSDAFIFEGNIIGNPEYTTGEVLVWMTEGSKSITIKSDQTGSLKFDFPDKLESKVVYKLTLTQTKNVQMLNLNVIPSDAQIYIDDTPQIATNGLLSILLEEGKHKYRIEHKYYHTDEGNFEIQTSQATALTINLKPNYGVIQIASKRKLNSLTIGDKVYKDITTITDTLFTGTYPITAKQEYAKKKLTVELGDGKTENIKMKFRLDFFVLGNMSAYKPNYGPDVNLYGITLGLCGVQGGYLSFKYGQSWSADGYNRLTVPTFSGGYLRKINKWLYLQAGIGYSDAYWNTYDSSHDSSSGNFTNYPHNIFIEGGAIFRLGKRFLLSLNYARGFGKGNSTTFTGSIGFVI